MKKFYPMGICKWYFEGCFFFNENLVVLSFYKKFHSIKNGTPILKYYFLHSLYGKIFFQTFSGPFFEKFFWDFLQFFLQKFLQKSGANLLQKLLKFFCRIFYRISEIFLQNFLQNFLKNFFVRAIENYFIYIITFIHKL